MSRPPTAAGALVLKFLADQHDGAASSNAIDHRPLIRLEEDGYVELVEWPGRVCRTGVAITAAGREAIRRVRP